LQNALSKLEIAHAQFANFLPKTDTNSNHKSNPNPGPDPNLKLLTPITILTLIHRITEATDAKTTLMALVGIGFRLILATILTKEHLAYMYTVSAVPSQETIIVF